MNSSHNIGDAGLYTDFSGLQTLRTKVAGHVDGQEKSAEAKQATKEVAKQFESLFLQMMLKEMRSATTTGESAESDQTRFYQEMFDKQIALDLANNGNGSLGIAEMLERDMGGSQVTSSQQNDTQLKKSEGLPIVNNIDLIRSQINRSATQMQPKDSNGQE